MKCNHPEEYRRKNHQIDSNTWSYECRLCGKIVIYEKVVRSVKE